MEFKKDTNLIVSDPPYKVGDKLIREFGDKKFLVRIVEISEDGKVQSEILEEIPE